MNARKWTIGLNLDEIWTKLDDNWTRFYDYWMILDEQLDALRTMVGDHCTRIAREMDENWTIVGRWLDENSMEK
jgi:hypothetical protein